MKAGLKSGLDKYKYKNPVGDVLVSFGFGSDLHHQSGTNNEGQGRYRLDGVKKLNEAVIEWNKHYLDFVLMNGDYIDNSGRSNAQAISDLAIIETEFNKLKVPRYYSFGNHDLDSNSKSEFINGTDMSVGYYSFDIFGVHFIVLDGCYGEDSDTSNYNNSNYAWTETYINPAQRTWLTNDLAATTKPTIIFCHQHLINVGLYSIVNNAVVRTIVENSGKVIGVFHGHSHLNNKINVNGIPYYLMEAMTDNPFPANAFAIITVKADESIIVKGYKGQTNYNL